MYVEIPPVLQCWITIFCSAVDFTVFCFTQSIDTEYMIPFAIEFELTGIARVLRIDFAKIVSALANIPDKSKIGRIALAFLFVNMLCYRTAASSGLQIFLLPPGRK
jgi:hypothetical protein